MTGSSERSKKAWVTRRNLMNVIDLELVKKLYYDQKAHMKQVAMSLNVSYTRLWNFMTSNNLLRRTLSEAGTLRFDRSGRKPYTRQFRRKLRVLERLGGTMCICCGCNDPRILELNHKNGGGHREKTYGYSGSGFYGAILNGRRKTEDLEVCCKVCNTLHYVRHAFGVNNYSISWREK